MTELEATRAKLKCLEMVEGTGLDWWSMARVKDGGHLFYNAIANHWKAQDIEFALGVVEGKPVWEGDKLYWIGENEITNEAHNFNCKDWSWNPPKPATLMVELPVEDVKFWNNLGEFFNFKNKDAYEIACSRFYNSCKKSLEKMK